MIWHIFKKDWKLMWPFVGAVAAVWWIQAFLSYHLGLFGENLALENLAAALLLAGAFGTMFLVVAIVHLDAVPGVRQDWLVRPIPRGKLLLEKLVFALALVIGPVFAANVLGALTSGFAPRSVLSAAAGAAVVFACLFVLPFFALGSVTENVTAAFIFGSICTVVGSVLLTSINVMDSSAHGTIVSAANATSGISWIASTLQFALVVVAAVVVLRIQYFHRRTMMGRFATISFGVLFLAVQLLPWSPAFAIERHFSAQPGAADGIELTFDASLGKSPSLSGLADSLMRIHSFDRNSANVFLPLRIAGIPHDSILISDRVDLHISNDGRGIYHGVGEDLEIDRNETSSPGQSAYQEVELPTSLYASVTEAMVAVRADYSLTLFGLANSYSLPALNGSERMPELGWCKTQINESETAVELRCMQLSKAPICATLFLENISTGHQNPPRSICSSSYGLTRHLLAYVSSAMARYGGNLPFRDTTGLAKYPVDGSQLAQSRVVIRVYEPVDHFTRTVTIPNIRLADWEAQ